MDSLTHIAMGAVIGEAVLGKQQGWRAWLWGAIFSTIPDLDVLFQWLFTTGGSLLFHRGPTHSILFCVLLSFLRAKWVNQIYKGDEKTYKGWLNLALVSLLTHSFVDIFNSYGVGILWPLKVRLVYDSLSIFDAFFFLLFFLSFIVILFLKRKSQFASRIVAFVGLLLGAGYIGHTIITKIGIEKRTRITLEAEGGKVNRIFTAPLPLTNFAWMVIAEDEEREGYWQSCYVTTNESYEPFSYIPKNKDAIRRFESDEEFKRLERFSRDFYAIAENAEGVDCFCDLRFSSFDFDGTGSPTSAVVVIELKTNENGELELDMPRLKRKITSDRLKNYLRKVRGRAKSPVELDLN